MEENTYLQNMIKATELRVGNIMNLRVTNPDGETVSAYGAIHTIAPDFIRIGDGIKADYRHIFPITLTAQIFKESGFVRSLSEGETWSHPKLGTIYFFQYKTGIVRHWFVKTCERSKLTTLRYVHQLQNFFYDITGEEIEINLPQHA